MYKYIYIYVYIYIYWVHKNAPQSSNNRGLFHTAHIDSLTYYIGDMGPTNISLRIYPSWG